MVERFTTLGKLKESVLSIVRGQKITYVTDAVLSEDNAARIVTLANTSDYLFIETPFLGNDEERAGARNHLTTRQAGRLACKAGVSQVIPFHFSPRYQCDAARFREEVANEFQEKSRERVKPDEVMDISAVRK